MENEEKSTGRRGLVLPGSLITGAEVRGRERRAPHEGHKRAPPLKGLRREVWWLLTAQRSR